MKLSKKAVFDKLVAKVNAIGTGGLLLVNDLVNQI